MADKKFEVFETNKEFWKKHVEDLDAKVQIALFSVLGDYDKIETYLKNGYEPSFGELTTAYELIDFELGSMLVKFGAEPSLSDIHEMIDQQDIGFIFFLIKAGLPVDLFMEKEARSRTGQTAMGLARALNDEKTIRLMTELQGQQSLVQH